MKQAYWRARSNGIDTTRYFLVDVSTRKRIAEVHGYSAWNNPKAEEASESIALAIEQEAEALGYTIIENPFD